MPMLRPSGRSVELADLLVNSPVALLTFSAAVLHRSALAAALKSNLVNLFTSLASQMHRTLPYFASVGHELAPEGNEVVGRQSRKKFLVENVIWLFRKLPLHVELRIVIEGEQHPNVLGKQILAISTTDDHVALTSGGGDLSQGAVRKSMQGQLLQDSVLGNLDYIDTFFVALRQDEALDEAIVQWEAEASCEMKQRVRYNTPRLRYANQERSFCGLPWYLRPDQVAGAHDNAGTLDFWSHDEVLV